MGQYIFIPNPVITKVAAVIFHNGKGSLKKIAAEPTPKTGTNNEIGATTAAGWRARSQAQAANPNKVLPQDCHRIAAHKGPLSPAKLASIKSHPQIPTIK